MRVSGWVTTLAMVLGASFLLACGSSGNDGGRDAGGDGTAQSDEGAGDAMDALDGVDLDGGRDGENESGSPDVPAGECTMANVATACAAVCADLDGCHKCACDLAINGGTCVVKTVANNQSCNDDNPFD